jgi:hypothetical protein
MDRPSRLPDNIQLINTLVEQGRLVLTPPHDYDDSYCIAHAQNHGGCVLLRSLPLRYARLDLHNPPTISCVCTR